VSGKDMQAILTQVILQNPLELYRNSICSKHLSGFFERTIVERIFATPLSHTIKKRRVVRSHMDGSDHP
jgi:hypothetical protein